MTSSQLHACCRTPHAYVMSKASNSGYQSLYSTERRDFHLPHVRKETFVFYPPSNIPTSDMVDAGFYYTGDGYEIKCFTCAMTVRKLNAGDRPFIVHQSRAPNCPFVRKTRTQGGVVYRTEHLGPTASINKAELKKENERLLAEITCRKCKQSRVQTLFLPCRHLIACEDCSDRVDDCIMCNDRILGTVRTYI